MTAAALAAITVTSGFLLVYGANLLYLSVRAARLPPARPSRGLPDPLPSVVVQLPIYDERHVAARVIEAAGALDWPRDRLSIQVLDDSDDDTTQLAAEAVVRLRARGIDACHVRREARKGYKAGALAEGLRRSEAELVAVFDADFVPPPDFLRRAVPALADPRVGFVQARWGHLNETHSLFTRMQALVIDFHYLVEQAVRARLGYPTNFTGSAGLWRRAAIDGAGGWRADTLTEDLDLSYRAQLRGWTAVFLEDLVVPQELPVSVNAYRTQQTRWATGSFQCARRLLRPLLQSRLPRFAKFQGTMHLLGYAAPLAMLIQLVAYAALLATDLHPAPAVTWWLAASLLSLAPTVGISVAQARRGRRWWAQLPAGLGWTLIGLGTSLTVATGVWRAARGGGEFRRTPKFAVRTGARERHAWRASSYFLPQDPFAWVELAAGLTTVAVLLAALSAHRWVMAAYALLFAAGFLTLGLGSFAQAVLVIRNFALTAAVFAACGAVLLVFAGQPDPFEDSYQHWLIAANLATSGHLNDPLFQMQDTWLPAYEVLAAGVLKVAGTWQLGALKLLSAALGFVTLGLTYALAGSRRRGLLAVLLLGFNPAFVLTSTTAVSEPLLVTALLGSVLAVARRRYGWAAALACLAGLTGTKAWVWLGCAAGFALLELLGRARTSGRLQGWRGRVVWIGPALALALVLEIGFGFASHSVARAALEVGSATARGSVPADSAFRAAQFLGYLALASLPAAVLAPVGIVRAVRGGDPLLRRLYLPSLAYLSVVAALIGAGLYTGSHRYYALALPALALLGAGGLDGLRLRWPAVLATGAAAAAVLAVYVPVLQGLAAGNRGLVEAGRAAGAVPGAIVTDSPAAAYWSHKAPGQIHGSRQLPDDRAGALAWLRSAGVGPVVVEDIDYYRAPQLFPGLASGRPQTPFLTVGNERAYTVPGGKTAYVYGVDRTSAPLGGGVSVQLQDYRGGSGKTAPLGKGPVLTAGGRELAGGGLGFGVPLVRYDDGWWYPSATTGLRPTPDGTGWQQEYDLSLREVDGPDGRFQRFAAGPSHGRVLVTYHLRAGQVDVQVRPVELAPGLREATVLNEESAGFASYADGSQTQQEAAIGSQRPVTGGWARLRSEGDRVEFGIEAPANVQSFSAARERLPGRGIDFSGLELGFGPGFSGTDYTVTVGST